MNIETIITDLDGTLLNSNNQIDYKTKEILIDAQKRGIKLILASGRSTNAMWPYAIELEMDKYNGLLLSYNGACVTDCKTKDTLYSMPLDKSTTTSILQHIKSFDTTVIVNDDNYVYVHDAYSGIVELDGYFGDKHETYNTIEGEARSGNYLIREVSDLAKFIDFPLYKILVVGYARYLNQYKDKIIEPFKETTTALFSSPFFLEFTHPNVDKGETIENILPKFGINIEKTIAFGDGMNDYNMLQKVKIGVAMKNAVPELKDIADTITESNDDKGIYKFLVNNLYNDLII